METLFPYNILDLMVEQLNSRQANLRRLGDYYDGKHRLAFASAKFLSAFGGMFASFADNFIPLVVGASAQRLHVQGFRNGDDPKSDKEAWGFWQRNGLDAASQLGHVESLKKGDAYVIVWADGDGQPRITVETPEQCIVGFEPGDRSKRAAGLKVWVDGAGKHAVLMFPTMIFRFVWNEAFGGSWAPEPSFDFPYANPLGVVPMVPLTNQPRLDSPFGTSEFFAIIGIQDAINKTVADMMVASEYVAFPQRYVTGLELPEDDQGNVKPPYALAVDKFLVAEDPGASFGTLAAGDTMNHIKQIEMFIQQIATQTFTPPHYFNVGGNLPSGDAIKAAEAGLTAKVTDKMIILGEAWEEVIRLCFKVVNDPRADIVNGETIWKDPQFRTESEMADALVKRAAIGVPRQQLWEDAGYTQSQIARFHAMEAQDALDEFLAPPEIPKIGVHQVQKIN